MDWPWTLLGIEPTRDASLIRRAYARQIKAGPDADRFQRLRRARETALREAGSPGPVARGDDTSRDEPDRQAERAIGRREEPIRSDRAEHETSQVEAVPQCKIVEIASLAETETHKIEAARLGPHIRGLLARLDARDFDAAAFARALDQAAMLPEGARRDVEAACIAALTAGWRKPDGVFDPQRVARATPLLVAADRAFGWNMDDTVLTAVLTPADADALNLILDEAHVSSLSPRLPAALRMRRPDALAFFVRSEARRALYEKAVRRGTMPWRFSWGAFAAPHAWAYGHRLWREMVLFYGAMCLPSLALMPWEIPDSWEPLLRTGLWISLLLTMGLAGFLADRMLFAAALRGIRRADRRALFDKQKRETFLSERNQMPSPAFLFFVWLPCWLPYWAILEMTTRLGG